MQSSTKRKISGDVNGSPEDIGRCSEAILRLSEVLSKCQEPEDLTGILSEELHEFLTFFVVLHHCLQREFDRSRMGRVVCRCASSTASIVAVKHYSGPFHILGWKTDKRIPARLKDGVASRGLDTGQLVFVPLTTPQRPLGALGMAGVRARSTPMMTSSSLATRRPCRCIRN